MKELQEILNKWAEWQAEHHKTGYKFVEATDYGKHSELKDYKSKQCVVKTQPIVYASNVQPAKGVNTLYSIDYDNEIDLPQTVTFSKEEKTETNFAWSITEAVKLGMEVSAKASVPEFVEVATKESVELSLSSTQSIGITRTDTWSLSVPIVVPPHKRVTCNMIAETRNYDAPFTQDVTLKGQVAIWYKDKVKQSSSSKDKHNLYFKPIGSVFKEVIGNKLIDTTGYKVIDQETVAAVAQGNFTGDRAVSVHVSTTQSASTGGATKRSADGGDVVASTDEPRSSTKFK